jgi:hypothetical protein
MTHEHSETTQRQVIPDRETRLCLSRACLRLRVSASEYLHFRHIVLDLELLAVLVEYALRELRECADGTARLRDDRDRTRDVLRLRGHAQHLRGTHTNTKGEGHMQSEGVSEECTALCHVDASSAHEDAGSARELHRLTSIERDTFCVFLSMAHSDSTVAYEDLCQHSVLSAYR